MDLPPPFRKRLFDAKSRVLGISNSLLYIPNQENAMEIDSPLERNGDGDMLKTLNDLCFPEFKLYMDGDVEDIKRCAKHLFKPKYKCIIRI
jgi:hypothetical protein